MSRSKELAEMKVGKTDVEVFLSLHLLAFFINALYNIVDRIYIGQGVGALALSGVNCDFFLLC